MTNGKISLIDIPDGKPVRAFLPIVERKNRFRVPCTFTYHQEEQFFLNFNPGILPSEGIEVNGTALISLDIGGLNSSIEAEVIQQVTNQRLLLQKIAAYTHEQLRDFFRVDAVTNVIGENFHSSVGGNGGSRAVEGQTIDISGNGVLVSFSEPPPETEYIKLNITLPNENNDVIQAVATETRTVQVADNRWEVAYQFQDIESDDRDKIIGYCLILQRQLLRLKVEIRS